MSHAVSVTLIGIATFRTTVVTFPSTSVSVPVMVPVANTPVGVATNWFKSRVPTNRTADVAALVTGMLSAALALANSIPSLARAYRTEQQFALFQIGVAISLTVGLIAVVCAAAVGFVLLSGGRPGWRAALRRSGSLGDAFARAAVAAVGTAGLTQWAAFAASRFPALFDLDPSIPPALERLLPGYAGFWSAATATFSFGVVAATIALARRTATARQPLWRVLALGALLLALAPTGARSAGEFLAAFLPEVVVAAWLAFCAFGLLRDHVAAWVLFGALYFGGARAVELLSQPAPPDRAAGWTVLVLCALAALALLAGRRTSEPAGRAGPAPDLEPAPPLPALSSEP